MAGPDALGRAVVVGRGEPAPEPWRDAERLVVDDATVADPTAAVEWFQARWSSRRRYVVELAVPMAATKAPTVDTRPAWELGADFELGLERLHHLIWSNA